MTVGPRLRFDVLKRDGFTCQYCGRRAPEVTLEVDHVVPVAEGGPDAYENLLAACEECNRGKGRRLLETVRVGRNLGVEAAELEAREAMVRAYNAAAEASAQRRIEEMNTARRYWLELWGEDRLDRWHMPWDNVLRSSLDTIGLEEVLDAMLITRTRYEGRPVSTAALKYLGGVLRAKAAQHG